MYVNAANFKCFHADVPRPSKRILKNLKKYEKNKNNYKTGCG